MTRRESLLAAIDSAAWLAARAFVAGARFVGRSALVALACCLLLAGAGLAGAAPEGAVPGSAASAAAPNVGEPHFEPIRAIVLRHAEKGTTPADDPGLSEAGTRRAEALAVMLERSGVTALYSSDRLRARATLEPLARKLGTKVTTFEGKDVAAFVRAVLSHPGGLVVVAGHSNTAGAIVEGLGAPKVPPMDESDFDDLYLVTVYAPGKATVTPLRWHP